jgi:DNA-binding SARP family transcriptional activator
MAHALPLFEQALESDPGAEDFYRCLITVYAGSGQDADALVGYSRCREILARHSGPGSPLEAEAPYRGVESSHFAVTDHNRTPH